MKTETQRWERWIPGGLMGVVLVGLFIISRYHFLLFHTLVELFSIVIAASVFAVAWNSRRWLDNDYLLFVGIAFLAVAAIDLLHTLAYKGMGIFPAHMEANLATQLWIAARYLHAGAMLAAPLYFTRKLRPGWMLLGFGVLTTLILAAVFGGVFPDAFIEGEGLTPFKIISEYIIAALFLLAIIPLRKHRDVFDAQVLRWLTLSLVISAVQEMFFTLYVDVYGLMNLMGHYCKLAAFYFIYQALIVRGLQHPYDVLFRDVEQQRNRAQKYLEIARVIIVALDVEGRVTLINQEGCDVLGYAEADIVGADWFARFMPEQEWEATLTVFRQLMAGDIEPARFHENALLTRAGEERIIAWRNTMLYDEAGQICGTLSSGQDITERKQMEDALRESEERYRLITQNAVDVIWTMDVEAQRFTYVSPSVERLRGYTPEEILAQPVEAALTPESARKVAELLAVRIPQFLADPANPVRAVDEMNQPHKDGGIVHTEVTTTIWFNPAGRLEVVGISRDITERRQAEAALRESESRFRSLFENSPIAYQSLNEAGQYVDVNHRLCELLGYSRDELLGRPFGEVWSEHTCHYFPQAFEGFKCRGAVVKELDLVHKDGSLLTVVLEGRTQRDLDGNFLRTHCILHDITERKRAEEALRHSETTYREIFNGIEDALFIHDINTGAIVDVNASMLAMFGYGREEVLALTIADLSAQVAPYTNARAVELIHRAAAGETLTFEWHNRKKNGDLFFSENLLKHVVIAGQERVLAIVRDITARKQMEDALRESEAWHRALFTEMVSGFAFHEIICDAEGQPVDYRFLAVNAAFERLTGLAAADLLGQRVMEVLPDTESYWIERYGQVALSGEPVEFEEYSGVVGKYYEVRVYCPEIGKFAVIFTDITARKQAEIALRESRDLLNATQRLAKVGGWEWDVGQQTMVWTDETYRIHGMTPGDPPAGSPEHIAQSLACYDEADRPVVAAAFERCIEHAEPYDIECPLTRVDGQRIWIQTVAAPVVEEGRVIKVTGNIFDITERKRIEDALRESEAKLQEAQDIARLGRWELHIATGDLAWSDSIFDLFEVSPETCEVSYETFLSFIHPDDRALVDQAYRESVANYAPYEIAHRLQMPDGRIKWVNEIGRTEYDAEGQPLRSVGTVQDITERKQAEESLRETRNYLENLLTFANAPIIVWNPDFIITRFNRAFERLTGLSSAEVIGQPLDILFPEASHDISMALIRRSVGQRWEVVEIPILNHQTGEPHAVLWNSAHVFGPDGETLQATIAQGTDITERKQTEDLMQARLRLMQFATTHTLDELLQETLDEVEALTGSLVSFYHFVDADQKTLTLQAWSTRTTREFCQAAGKGLHYAIDEAGVWVDCVRERQPIIHNDYAALPHRQGLPPGHAPVIRELVVPIFRDERIVAILGVGNKPGDYTERDMDIVTYIADVAWEIVERKLAAEKLARAADVHATMAALGKALISATSLEDVSDLVLEHARRLTGSTFGFVGYIDPATGALISPTMTREIWEGCQVPDKTFIFDKFGGMWGWVLNHREALLTNTPEADPRATGVPPGHIRIERFLGVPALFDETLMGIISLANPARDYTPDDQALIARMASLYALAVQRQHAADALQQAKEAAEAASHAKSAFLANMSHELRTPLNAILGFTQLMARDIRLDAGQYENLDTILRSGEHLLGLINDVLAMSKIEAGRVTLDQRGFDLHRLLEGLEEMFALRAEDKGLAFIFEVFPETPRYVYADEGKLRQILTNLLSNAVKFTESGGVNLRVKGVTGDPPPSCPRGSDCCWLHFEVQDTGRGIAAEELQELFNPFVQTASGRDVQEGTGLGLAISHQFVELMGGTLEVESDAGRGALFKFSVPVALTDAIAVNSHRARRVVGIAEGQVSANGQPYRILIVEDRETNRRLLAQLLKPLGFQVREAANGQEGVQVWREWQPHLIFMDMRMPVMSGYEATRRIKDTAQGQATVVVALTASAFEEDRLLILSEGCDDFVSKPFREVDLYNVLRKHLGVEFLYADTPDEAATPDEDKSPDAALQAVLKAQSPEWRAAFRQAIDRAEFDGMQTLIAELQPDHAAAAAQLLALVYHFDYDALWTLLQEDTDV